MRLALDANVLIAAFVARGVCADKDPLDLGSYKDIAIVSPRSFWSFESHRRSGG